MNSRFLKKSVGTLGLLSSLSLSFSLGPGRPFTADTRPFRAPNVSFCDNEPLNPLQDNRGLPRFGSILPSHVKPAVSFDLENMKTSFKKFEEDLPKAHTYEAVVDRLDRIEYPLGFSWGVASHLLSVKNSEELRAAYEEMQPQVVEAQQITGQSKALYEALEFIRNQERVWGSLDNSQQRIVSSYLRQMKQSGVGLEGETKERFNKLQLRAAELATKFSNNVLDSTKAFKRTVTDPSDIEGLPASGRALAAQKAKANGHENATAENGPWTLTLDLPSYVPAMQHLKNRAIREELYRAYISRASSGEKDNTPIITEILQIKKEIASILGYSNYADLSLSRKMAPSIESVMDLISMLRERSYPAAQRDIEEVRAFAKTHGFTGDIALWDVPYWSERLRESAYEFQEEELRPYFALPAVLDGMFSLANRLFGVTIERADGQAEVWHPDVQYFNIRDSETGEHLSSFFLDPYSRPADKNGGAWMNVCIGKSKAMNKMPVAYLICNGSPPVDGKPSLMTFREVETLFHEFGHGLQHMLTRVEHAQAAGISNIEWDAVELPSQFMENWCYDKPTLYGFASHYSTGEPLPEELFNKIKAAKNFQSGLQMLRQLSFGAIDMHLHSSFDPHGSKTPFEAQRELASLYSIIPPLPEDRFLCAFSHIFAGGYSAGYYSYKWAEVMSADAFGAFEEAGLDNEEAVKRTGRRFRETVLALGGGTHPSEVYRAFRGRDPSPDALLRHSDLTSNK